MLALGLLVVFSYLPAMLWGGFVWDDRVITEAPPLHHWTGIWSIWFSPSALRLWEGHYWPLVYTTFWLEHKLWGLTPAGYHTVNVALHLANTLLLWHLLKRLAVPGAWVAAAVFAIHPVHVESVAWVLERKDVLSGLFYLTAFLAWIRFIESSASGARYYLLALALFGLGLLCKSIVVTLPVALLIWHWWKRGGVTSIDLLRLAPFFAVGLGIATADALFYRSNEELALGYSVWERLLIAAQALWFYAGKLLWPINLAVIYPHWALTSLLAWGYLIAAGTVVALLWLFRGQIGRGPFACVLFFMVTLSPVLGFVDYGYMQFSFVADRYQYLASIGLIVVFVGSVGYGADRLSGVARWGIIVVVPALLILLGILTWQQASIYQNKVTFWNHVIAHNPTARNAHYNLGTALGELDQLREAEEHLHQALRLNPRHASALQNLASVQVRQHSNEKALETYQRLIKIAPRNAAAYSGRAIALHYLGRHEEALQSIDQALALDPNFEQAKANRELMPQLKAHADAGLVLIQRGQLDEAEKHLRQVLEIDPRYTFALHNLALVQLKQQRYEAALSLYRRWLEIEPASANAYAGLGITLHYLGQTEAALQNLRQALSLDPTLKEARINLDTIQESLRQNSE